MIILHIMGTIKNLKHQLDIVDKGEIIALVGSTESHLAPTYILNGENLSQ